MTIEPSLRPWEVEVKDRTLWIRFHKGTGRANLRVDWAQEIVTAHPGPFDQVEIEMSQVNWVNSAFFAGLVRLHGQYQRTSGRPLVLIGADARVLKNLAMLRLDRLVDVRKP